MSSETYPRVVERHNAGAELREGDRICLERSQRGVITRLELVFKEFNAWGSVVNMEGQAVSLGSDMTLTLLERSKRPLPKPGDTVLVLGSTDPDVEGNLPLVGFVEWDGDLNWINREGHFTWIDIDSLTDWKLITVENNKVVTHD